MIAKTSIGSDFVGALEYGAGLRSDRTNKQSELLSVSNLGSVDAHGIAAEMRAVAEASSKIQKPVWHTSLSWPAGEQVSREQKLRAAALYCELIGASLSRHQIAVYEHKDKAHPHIHIYINRVPLDEGPALDTAHNYARNVKATEQIREQLGMRPLPTWQLGTKSHDPAREAARAYVQQALAAALNSGRIASPEQLAAELERQGIDVAFKHDSRGQLVGTSFRYQGQNIKGTEAGYKAKQLRQYFDALPSAALALSTGAPLAGPSVPAQAASAGTGGEDGLLVKLSDTDLLTGPAGADDAGRNENERRRKRRKLRL